MFLSYEQIKNVTVGSLRTEQRDDGIHFSKLTDKQHAFWTGLNEIMARIAGTTSGVHLDFLTDATAVTFTTANGGKYEIYKNRLLAEQVDGPEPHRIVFPLKNKADTFLNRVTFYLPSHGPAGILSSVELTDGTVCARPEYPVKMLFCGDSLTEGWDSEIDTHSWAIRIARYYDAEALVQGVAGSFFSTVGWNDIDFDPDIVFVALGTNDFNYYEGHDDDFKRELSGYLDRVATLYADKTVIAISPVTCPCYEGEKKERFIRHSHTILREEALRGFICVDGLTLVPNVKPLFIEDNLHLNGDGYSAYAENLLRQIDPVIRNVIAEKKRGCNEQR